MNVFRIPWQFRAVLLASALATVFAARVFVSFDGLRVKLIREPVPVTAGSIDVESRHDARSTALRGPVALIAVVTNPDGLIHQFSVTVGGRPVCAVPVAGRSTERIDCAVPEAWAPGTSPVIGVAADTPVWTLEFLEAATHHGSSSRLIPFYVLPATSTHYVRPGWVSVGLVVAVVLAVFSVPTAVWPTWAVRTHRGVVAAAGLWFVAVAAAPWVSPYLLMMPVRSFVILCAVLVAPQLAGAGAMGVRAMVRVVRAQWLRRPAVAVVAVGVFATVPFALVVRQSAAEFHGNYSGLLRISETWFNRSPLLAEQPEVRETLALLPDDGYDAQFAYFAAFDPLMRRFTHRPDAYRAVADAPPYRFGRIGFPWMVRAVAWSEWRWFPVVMIGLVLLGVSVSAGATAWLAHRSGRSALWGLLMLAVPGFWESARVVLPEPIAAATLLVGCCCVLTHRIRTAAALFAVSLLVRETGVILLLSLVLFLPASTLRRDRLWLTASMVPLLLWRMYLAMVLWPDWGWQGLVYSPGNVGLPLVGIVHLWSELARGTYYPGMNDLIRAATWYPVVLIATAGIAWFVRRALPRPAAVALGVYVVLALSLTFPVIWGHVANAQRGSYEMFVVLAAGGASASTHSRSHRAAILAGAVLSLLFVLFGAHDALLIREALFP